MMDVFSAAHNIENIHFITEENVYYIFIFNYRDFYI